MVVFKLYLNLTVLIEDIKINIILLLLKQNYIICVIADFVLNVQKRGLGLRNTSYYFENKICCWILKQEILIYVKTKLKKKHI